MSKQLPELDPRFGEADLSQPVSDTYISEVNATPPIDGILGELWQMVESGKITATQAEQIADQLLREL